MSLDEMGDRNFVVVVVKEAVVMLVMVDCSNYSLVLLFFGLYGRLLAMENSSVLSAITIVVVVVDSILLTADDKLLS